MPEARFSGEVCASGPLGSIGNKVDRDYAVQGTIKNVNLQYELEPEGGASKVMGRRGDATHEIIAGNKVRVHAWVDAGTRMRYTLEVLHARVG
jgi:hypothetical protein